MEFDIIDINIEEQIKCMEQLFVDPEVKKYLPLFELHDNFQDFIHFIGQDLVHQDQRLVKYHQDYIGWISIHKVNAKQINFIELSYAVIKEKRGHGYGRQLIEAFIFSCKDEIEEIVMLVDKDNSYSRDIVASLGFEMKSDTPNEDKYQYCYKILRKSQVN